VSDGDRHRYGCDRPVEQFPRAIRDFYERRWGVSLAEDQVVTTMGSKDAIAKMGLALLNPGDVGIAIIPGYPTYNITHVFAGAVTYQLPLRAENAFLPDLEDVAAEIRQQAKILWLNYPNNPTTAVAPMEFFERAVEFARQNDILIAHDAAYSENTYDGYRAPSILQVEGADEVAVELFSLSKAFNMTGWRAGFVVGNASTVGALKTVKGNIDNGSLRSVQFAACRMRSCRRSMPSINAAATWWSKHSTQTDGTSKNPRPPSMSGRPCRAGMTATAVPLPQNSWRRPA
jgi:LL-diaminopimelate aminotransferase